MHDLIIRHGTVVDGTGGASFEADIAIAGGKIVEIGQVNGRGRDEIDARGRIVTPGFVDIHSHYDGQATWDSQLAPSSLHGVTTVMMGNCGVGFAPVRPGEASRRALIELMEGVEDIPGTALWEGINWTWESYPEYLDAIGERKYTMDVAALVPHSALRVYVMGERGSRNEAATSDDIAEMARLAEQGIKAGALGFSTNRIIGHQTIHGVPVPGTFASMDELGGIGRAVGAAGGLFQLAPGGGTGSGPKKYELESQKEPALRDEFHWMAELSRQANMKVTFLLAEHSDNPEAWKDGLRWTAEENAKGAKLFPQIAARSLGFLLCFEGHNMFERRPTFMKLKSKKLAFPDLLRELRKPEVRQAILSEVSVPIDSVYIMDSVIMAFENLLDYTYPLGVGDKSRYDPSAEMSVQALAAKTGVTAEQFAYDLMLENEGSGMLLLPGLNYARRNEDAMYSMLSSHDTVLGLADGGAHCSATCDGSTPTYMLSHWVRDRQRGPRLSLEAAVSKQTSETAKMLGLEDRGVIAIGKRADLNVIDLDNLALLPPYIRHDLPAGGWRMMQEARGYTATIVGGTIVRRDGQDTGARPGRLLRKAHCERDITTA